MVQDFDDIMSNYQDMSVEELGTSLLKRQAQQRAEIAKTSKKNQKIQQALGVLLAGQSIFKNAFNRREEELEELKTLDLLNVENDAKKLRGVADVMSIIPENYFPELNAVERTNKFFTNRSLSNQFQNKLVPLIEAQLKGTTVDKNSPEYKSIVEYGSRKVLLNIFEGNKHEKFYKDLQTLDPSITSRDELFNTYMEISPQQLTQQKTKLYRQIENELRQKSGVIGGIKGVLRKISGDKEAEGQLGLFSNITEKDIEGANLSEMLDSINIVGTLLPSIDKAVSASQISPQRYRNLAQSEQSKTLRANIEGISFESLMEDIEEDRVLDKFGLLSAVDTSKFEKMNKYFEMNTRDRDTMFTDATALSLRFQDDPQFAIDLYKTVTSDPKKIKQFASQIREIQFRNKFALAMTISAGSNPKWRASNSDYIGTDLYMKDLDSQGYDPTLGYNNMTGLVEDPIIIDSDGNFKATKDYTQLYKNQKLNIIDKKVDTILNADISQEAKQRTIDNLFDNIDIPEIENQEDYFNYRKSKDSLNQAEMNLSGLQRQEYDKNIREINRLENIVEQGGGEIFGTKIPTSPQALDRIKESINSLKQENMNILATPEGGNISKIAELQKEIDDFEATKEQIRYEVPANMFNMKQEQINKKKAELAELQANATSPIIKKEINVFEPQAVGEDVTRKAIEAVTFGNKKATTFLSRVALVESDFGTDKNTFKQKDSSGIFQIEREGAYAEVMRRLDPEADVGASVRRYNEQLKDSYGIDLTQMSYEDLEQPIIGAAFARAFLLTVPEEIPTDLQEQGEYWKKYYNTVLGKGTPARFVREARFKRI